MDSSLGLDDASSSNNSRWRRSDPPNPSFFSFLRDPPPAMPRPNPVTNPLNDSRSALQRRFTTSTYVSPLSQARRPAFEPHLPEVPLTFQSKISPSEKKKAEYEYLRMRQLERQNQLEQLSQESRREELELHRLSQELAFHNGAGHQSEPTTPPEYRDTGFPSSLSRPSSNRFSASNLISPPGLFNRKSQTDSTLASPPSERSRAYNATLNALTGAPPRSGQQSKQNSDEEDSFDEPFDLRHRAASALNRNSMPVTRRDLGRNGVADSGLLDQVNTHAFLFGDDDRRDLAENVSSTPRPKSYLHMNQNDDQFPVLLRRDGDGNMQFTASSNGFDPNSTDSSEPSSSQASKRSSLRRSLPPQNPSNGLAKITNGESDPFIFAQNHLFTGSSQKSDGPTRHSLGASAKENKRPGLIGSPPSGSADINTSAPKLQSSYSTNDIPTIKSTGSTGVTNPNTLSPYSNANTTAEQRLHNHNASLGRIPAGAVNGQRHSRELSTGSDPAGEEKSFQMPSMQSVLQGGSASSMQSPPPTSASTSQSILQPNAPPFGSSPSFTPSDATPSSTSFTATTMMPFGNQQVYSGYGMQGGMQMLNASMGNMSLGTQNQWNNPQMFGQQMSAFNAYQPYGGAAGRFQDGQNRNNQQRRTQGSDDSSRFQNISIESIRGEIYTLCKDQHGCRYLQKKLEENKPSQTAMIFDETKDHMVELMTDPFGNYLCQKLLEHTDSDQHTVLINNAAPHMVKIALNQHGTRALQKMIEYISTPEQINTLIYALKDQVVPMIQDLNGNHVIQKCLNRLAPPDVQFIIDAVAAFCVVVGTHRHGCCVIQRCIDHATGEQKAQLVEAITMSSFPLVQDPFGNYVLQYIFDQGEDSFSQRLCRQFLGRIANLSKQKFSSNVIEKCIRIAEPELRHQMIEEIINCPEFDRLADDSFANYVVQTAWDHANPEDEARLADRIRPVLPRMRNKPYGRRFQSRITERDKRFGINTSGSITPNEMGTGESITGFQPNSMSSPLNSHLGRHDNSFFQGNEHNFHGTGYGQFGNNSFNNPQSFNNGNEYRPQSHRFSNPPAFSNMNQYQGSGALQQQYGGGYGRQQTGIHPF